MQMSREEMLHAFRTMCTCRHFEENVQQEFAEGKIPGFVHLSAGQEATAAGVMMNLDERDWITTTHRGHSHCIARGMDLQETMDEIFGARTGVCGGKGGSMHIADVDKGMLGANGILGATGPLAVGAALTAKAKNKGGIALSFFGDGGANEGMVYESYNLASIWKLPVIFIIDDNGYAESTAASWAVAGCPVKRAEGFGIPGVRVDGTDFFAIHDAVKSAVENARNGEGPQFIHIKSNRFFGHFEGDAQTYRAEGEVEELRANKDVIKIFKEKVVAAALFSPDELDDVFEEEGKRINHGS